MMKKIISILFMLMLLGATAFAAEDAVYDIDTDNHRITVRGTVSAYEGVPIIILKPADIADSDNAANIALFKDKAFYSPVKAKVGTVLRSGVAAIDETNIGDYKLHFTFVVADESGNYALTLPLPAEPVNDMVYLLSVSGGSYANSYEAIAVYSPSDFTIEAAKTAVNNAVTVDGLIDAINRYDIVFGLDTENEVYKSLSGYIAQAIMETKGSAAYTSFTDLKNESSFKSHYKKALAYYTRQAEAVNKINSATQDSLKDILETYSQDTNVLGVYGGEKLNFTAAYNTYGYLEVNRHLVGIAYADMVEFTDKFKSVTATLAAQTVNPLPQAPSGSGGGSGGGGGGGSMYVPDPKPPQAPPEEPIFTDLASAAWAEESILRLVDRGVIDGMGDGTFNPNGNVTREQFVKMLLLSFNATLSSSVSNFADVDGNAWYAPYINTAYELGIVNGVSETEFGVGSEITRQDFATMAVRACEVFGLTVSNEKEVSFTDAALIAEYAYKPVMTLAKAGVVNGVSEGVFAPLEKTTRAQVAVILDRLYNA